jgi:molecular chaperone DnaK
LLQDHVGARVDEEVHACMLSCGADRFDLAKMEVVRLLAVFEIDANGILHVSAKDKATGKENKITIKANSGLSDDEIKKMVADAEANAESDKQRVELVQARNAGEAMVHSVKKSLDEHGSKLSADEKAKIEEAIKELEAALPGEDKDAIETKTDNLMKASQTLGEKVYAEAQAAAGGAGAGAAGGATGSGSGNAGAEDVVDAEFKEVKRD